MSSISLNNLQHILARHWLLVVSVSVLLFIGSASYVLSIPSAYTSSAVVLLAPTSEELKEEGKTGNSMTDPFFVRSETAILSGDGVSRAVIERLELWKYPEFLPSPGVIDRFRGFLKSQIGVDARGSKNAGELSDKEILLDRVRRQYKERLEIFNDGRSKTVEVEFAATSPRLAAEIANEHAETYLLQQSVRRMDHQQKTLEWLAHEVDQRAEEVKDAEAQVQQYQIEHGIVSANQSTLVEQRLSQLSTQLVEARRQLSTQTALLFEIRQLRSSRDPQTAVKLLADESLKTLLQRRVTAEADVLALSKRLATTHPTLVKQRQELASVDAALNDQLSRLESQAKSSASWWQRQVNDLNQAVSAETTSKVSQDKVAVALPALVAQAQVKRTVFETVLNRYQTLMAEQSMAAPAATIVTRAVPSSRPSRPNTSLLLLLSAMGSVTCGVLSAILVQLRKPSSLGLTEVADAVDIRPLVAIPRFRNASRIDGVVKIKDPALFIESIRFLRDVVLDKHKQGERGVTCLVTSVLPRQGKSLTAMSLARSIARADRRTLFIEMDLRRPTGSSLARRAPPVRGLAAVLEGRTSVAEAVVRDENTGLHMLLAERSASTALDRLTTHSLGDLLAQLQDQYDAIVIDSPPVGLVSDALALAPLVNQTIIVAKDSDVSVIELKRGVRSLKDRGATVAGLVLTSVDPIGMSTVDRKTMHRYAIGVPAAISIDSKRKTVNG